LVSIALSIPSQAGVNEDVSIEGIQKGVLSMLRIKFAQLVLCIGLVALVAGCAGPSANIASDASGPIAAAFSPASDLTGTWSGSFNQVSAIFYIDDGDVVLQIKEDGTFVARVTRSKAGTNNLAKPGTWTGTVVSSGNRVTLRSSQGPWLTLVRSGNTLYAVAEDPLVEATIMLRLEREGSAG
jgi:hypothetical protein